MMPETPDPPDFFEAPFAYFLQYLPQAPLPEAWRAQLELWNIEPWIAIFFLLSFGPLILSAVYGYIQAFFHNLSIRRREKLFANIVLSGFIRYVGPGQTGGALVAGSVVISPGAFRRLLVAIRLLIGGRVGAYHGLLIRARREAVLRMKAAAAAEGATGVRGVRFHTATIVGGDRGVMRAIEVTAFGSAVRAR